MKPKKTWKDWVFKISVSFITGIFMVLLLIFINPISELKNIINLELSVWTFAEVLWFYIIGWSIVELSLLISRTMEWFIPWEVSARKRFFVQLLVQCIAVLTILMLLIAVTDLLFASDGENLEDDSVGFRQILFISVVLSTVVTTIHSVNYLINKWKESILEAANLKQVVMESQLQSLKSQLDPHFLFNNFSALSSLIDEDKEKAQAFLESLSQVHRYMLFNLDKNIVPLKNELEFINTYIYLIKIRFGNNLDIWIDDINEVEDKGIPPIALQILIENAVKHNIASKSHPLKIKVFIEGEMIVVSNNLQKMPGQAYSSKIGLQNIVDRYTLLSEKKPLILESDQEFTVKLPLLNLSF
uniref:sensor histidine kinase n=1 Tax=Pedobacter schmidteae TaxID=2201271 RepID=UPI000EB148A0|nr:histidine kinase [Pedobacter schmidteae]